MQIHTLWPGGPCLRETPEVFPLGTDAVLLADFAGKSGFRTLCDLGCGSGVIALLMLLARPAATALCVDLQPMAVALARENASENGLDSRMQAKLGDIRTPRDIAPAGSFDLTVANPPYFPVGSGKSAAGESRRRAREERTCTLSDVCTAAAHLTRWGGKFCLVHRPERLAEVISTLSAAGLEPKRLRFVQNTVSDAPNLFLLESRRGGSPGLVIEPALVLTDGAGRESPEMRQICHRIPETP